MLKRISLLKKNILANFIGNIWSGVMAIIFVPIYIKFLGIEAYGLMGIFASMLTIFTLLDMGISDTLNREMAILVVQPNKASEMRNLVRTLEIPYWLIGVLIVLIVGFSSSFISYHWVNVGKLSHESVRLSIILMGFAIAFQWPLSFYSGGLMGLQRQVLLNSINSVMATFRGLGAVFILWLVSPTIEAFFIWQILASIIHTSLITFFLWNSLPISRESVRFDRQLLLKIWRFAAGITGITLLALILTQLDKIILSRMLSLEIFGYYTLAQVVASILYRFFGPIFTATFPKLSNLVALNSLDELKVIYHKSCQLLSVIVLPAAFIIAFFSKEILFMWTQNKVTSDNSYMLVSLLVIGTAFNGLMHIPYAMQLANGWTKLSFYINLVSVILLAPLLILFTKLFGAVGAASIWVILNTGYLFITIPLMHKRLMIKEKWRWYLQDIGAPLIVAFIVVSFFRFLIPLPLPGVFLFLYIFSVSIITFALTAIATPLTRVYIQANYLKFKKNYGFHY